MCKINEYNELKATGNKRYICSLTLYLNWSACVWKDFREYFFFFFFFYFFCDIVKLICELRHKFFIKLWLRKINGLRPSALFLRNLRSAAGKFIHSAVCGNTYAPAPPWNSNLKHELCIFEIIILNIK